MENVKNINTDMRIKPYRKDSEYSYTCGVFPTIELLKKKPKEVFRVILSSAGEKSNGAEIIRDLAGKHNIPVIVDDKTIERISAKENCQAIGCFVKYQEKIDIDTNHVCLVNPSDMGNMGTIIRTSSGFGYENIAIVTPACDIFDPKTIRASMGAFFNVKIQLFETFEEYLKTATKHGERNIYPFMLKGKKLTTQVADEAYEESLKGKHFTIVFGNEARGLDDSYLNIGKPVLIPIRDTVDSLNLPIAVSIGEYMFTHRGDNI